MRGSNVADARPRRGRGFWLPAGALVQREIVRFARQPGRIIGSVGTPLLLWLFFGAGIGPAMRADATGSDPFLFYLPGAILLVVLFTSIFSNISLIEDRHEGFLQAVLVSPISRIAIVIGKIGGGAIIASLQGALLLALGAASGVHFPWARVPGALASIALLSVALSALGFVFAWTFDSVQAFHGVMNLVLMPLWLLSGAVFPVSGTHGVIHAMMAVNPATYGLELLRGAIEPSGGTQGNVPVLVTAAFALVCVGASVAFTRGDRRSTTRG